jgi:hypothetical protein
MEGDITLTLPRETFDQARTFVKAFGQALDAADAAVKAEEKAAGAHEAMSGIMNPQDAGLGGFGEELNAASNSGLGGLPV